MTTAIPLSTKPRDTAKPLAKDFRQQEPVPCLLYGHNVKNQSLVCDYQDLHNVFVKAGENTLIGLEAEGKSISVLIHQVDFHPVSGRFIHVDFYAPDMTKEITTNIPIRTKGESIGVKDGGGILITHRKTITVKSLPKDLHHEIAEDL